MSRFRSSKVHHSTYISYRKMLVRCLNPNHHKFPTYGGRQPNPVTVCDRWNPKAGGSFESFLADNGPRPEGTTLHRVNGNKGYCSENCVWADATTQARESRQCKLDVFKVIFIKQNYVPRKSRHLAHKFGVSQQTILDIVNGKTWKDVVCVKSNQGVYAAA